MKTEFLGKTVSGPFTIPSGIVSTAPSIIQRIFNDLPEIGVVTTKSVGPSPRAGNREPVYSQYAPGCFVNAVGLTNPGAEEARKGFESLIVPDDRFLLVSIFGARLICFASVSNAIKSIVIYGLVIFMRRFMTGRCRNYWSCATNGRPKAMTI